MPDTPDASPPAQSRRIRALRADDLKRGLELSTEAGWNQTEADWQWLLENCRGYGVELPGFGLVGTTMAWEPEPEESWINMVLVTEPCRGRGLARDLMQACLRDIRQEGRRALLDASDLGEPVYRKLGFSGSERIVRLMLDKHVASSAAPMPELKAMKAGDLDRVVALDRAVAGINRAALLRHLHARHPGAAWWLADEAGNMVGFSTGRDGRMAYQIGPIIAPDRAAAKHLLLRALELTPGPVILDVPERHVDWLAELRAMGFEAGRSFIRMGLDDARWATDWSRYYAIVGPDLT